MLDGDQGILLKFTYLLGNIFGLMLAVYKCHSMGILPTAPSDWLAFKEHRQVYSLELYLFSFCAHWMICVIKFSVIAN